MNDLGLLLKMLADNGPGAMFGAVFIWLYLQERKRCSDLTNRLADTGDKMAGAMERNAAASASLTEVVRAAVGPR